MKTLGKYFTASSASTRLTVSCALAAVTVAMAGSVRRWSALTGVSRERGAVTVIALMVRTVSARAVSARAVVSRAGGVPCAPSGAASRHMSGTKREARIVVVRDRGTQPRSRAASAAHVDCGMRRPLPGEQVGDEQRSACYGELRRIRRAAGPARRGGGGRARAGPGGD